MPLARLHFQALSAVRLEEARTLLAAGFHAGAYYLAGYAVELGLKASIAGQFKSEAIPDWPYFRDARTHRIGELVGLAGLEAELRDTRARDAQFDVNWESIANWRVDSRYEATSAALASELLEALDDPIHGVMRWIRTHW